jgi:hypothetical protein
VAGDDGGEEVAGAALEVAVSGLGSDGDAGFESLAFEVDPAFAFEAVAPVFEPVFDFVLAVPLCCA